MTKVYGVIMAGGGGTRFWPLSTKARPKQLLSLSGKEAMINETADRIFKVADKENVFAVTSVLQADELIKIAKGRIKAENVLKEPSARNTAACIGYAAAYILKKFGDGVMIVTPSDAFVKDEEEYARVLRLAVSAAEKGGIVTVGITPTFPATGYGYIRFAAGEGEVKKVERFVEKPSLEKAEEYLKSGKYVWNSGVFVFRASVIEEELKKHLPEVYAPIEEIKKAVGTPEEKEVLNRIYPQIPSVSIDYGVMEKTDSISVIPASFGWNDVGSFDMLKVFHAQDENGNISVGDNVIIDSKETTVYSTGRTVAVLGADNLVVVETPSAVLVIDKSRVQEVKRITDELKARGKEELL